MDIAFISKTGGREQNQDYLEWKASEQKGYFVLADGLGGHNGGEQAAKIAVETLLKIDPTSLKQLDDGFEMAHQAILTAQQANYEHEEMASTIVALSIYQQEAIWGHVGDARIYLIRDGKILHQSKDHSIPQLLVSDGEIDADEIRHHPDRNRLHRALGDKHTNIKARLSKTPQIIKKGDVFLLCSDGFWEWITEDKMLDYLLISDSSEQWLLSMEDYILKRVTGNFDNYSAISIFC